MPRKIGCRVLAAIAVVLGLGLPLAMRGEDGGSSAVDSAKDAGLAELQSYLAGKAADALMPTSGTPLDKPTRDLTANTIDRAVSAAREGSDWKDVAEHFGDLKDLSDAIGDYVKKQLGEAGGKLGAVGGEGWQPRDPEAEYRAGEYSRYECPWCKERFVFPRDDFKFLAHHCGVDRKKRDEILEKERRKYLWDCQWAQRMKADQARARAEDERRKAQAEAEQAYQEATQSVGREVAHLERQAKEYEDPRYFARKKAEAEAKWRRNVGAAWDRAQQRQGAAMDEAILQQAWAAMLANMGRAPGGDGHPGRVPSPAPASREEWWVIPSVYNRGEVVAERVVSASDPMLAEAHKLAQKGWGSPRGPYATREQAEAACRKWRPFTLGK